MWGSPGPVGDGVSRDFVLGGFWRSLGSSAYVGGKEHGPQNSDPSLEIVRPPRRPGGLTLQARGSECKGKKGQTTSDLI